MKINQKELIKISVIKLLDFIGNLIILFVLNQIKQNNGSFLNISKNWTSIDVFNAIILKEDNIFER